MAAIFQDGHHRSEAIKSYKGLFGDTSMKIGMSSLCGSLDNSPPTATWNVKMAAIFQDGCQLSALEGNFFLFACKFICYLFDLYMVS